MITSQSSTVLGLLFRYLGLAAFNGMALIIIYAFLGDDNLNLAVVCAVITLLANLVIFVPRLSPLRWVAPGLLLAVLFVIYPILYTVVTAFTNYGDGNMLTKGQALTLFERQQFVPDNAQTYRWNVYRNHDGTYALWLSGTDANGNPTAAFAPMDAPIEDIASAPSEPPAEYQGYRQLTTAERTQALGVLQSATFGIGDDTATIANSRQAARPLVQRYVFNPEQNTLLDRQTETLYLADDVRGMFVPEGGTLEQALVPGYRVNVGLENFQRLFQNSTFFSPLINVTIWTIAFAVLSVTFSFGFGLMMAMILDHPFVPFRRFWRSIIFIPYAIPAVISILVWRGLLNQNVGIVTNTIAEITGVRIPWFTDPWTAKAALLLVDLWLGYPYMMLVCSGALKAIPRELYEAASVDGARPFATFWRITLPLLLISVGPLLIAAFTFNFNNYLLIELLTEGNPPMTGTPTVVGYTDILISYTYNLAFAGGLGRYVNYGYAAAITIVIFIAMVAIALFNYRFVARWEKVSENV